MPTLVGTPELAISVVARRLELRAIRQLDDVVLQSLGFQMLQLTEDPHQLVIHNERGFLAGRVHRDVAAWIRTVRAQSLHVGQPLLRHHARLIDGRFAVLAQRGLAALAGVGAVPES